MMVGSALKVAVAFVGGVCWVGVGWGGGERELPVWLSGGLWFKVGKRERADTKSFGARLCSIVVAATAAVSVGDLVGRKGFGMSG